MRASAEYTGFGLAKITTDSTAWASSALFFGASIDLIILVREAGRLHAATSATSARWRNCNSIAKSRAGNNSSCAIRAASSIPVPGTRGKRRISKLSDIGSLVRVTRPGDTIGITEPAGLNFVEWLALDRRHCRAAARHHSGFHRLTGTRRLVRGHFEFHGLKRIVYLGKRRINLAGLRP